MFYLKMSEDISKFIRLFERSFTDIASFLLIFLLILLVQTMCLHVLGAEFDGGKNFDADYDEMHEDYIKLPYFGVIFASNFRTAVGDLQPPGYDYWVAQFDKK